MRHAASQAARFVLVGAAASGVHATAGLALAYAVGWAPWAANLAAFFCALGVSYLGNARLTFGTAADGRHFVRFAALSAAAFAYNQALVSALTGAGWSYAAALAVVLATAPPLTFLLSKRWVFRPKPAL